MKTSLLAATVLFAMAVPAVSQSTYPASVAAGIEEYRSMCTAFKPEKGFARNDVDLNGDGVKDWIFDYQFVDCDEAASFFCGSAGCTIQILVSDAPNHWAVKYAGNAQGYSIGTRKGRKVVKLGLHESACGKIGAEPCGDILDFSKKR